MTQPDILAALGMLNPKAPFNRWMDLRVTAAGSGHAEIWMPWREEAGQYVGFLHAGLIGALIDTACGYAAYSVAGNVLTSHYSVNCLAPCVGAAFRARGSVVKAGRRQIFARAELCAAADGSEKLVATGEAVLMKVD